MDFPVDYFTGDGTSTTFQLSRIPASATSILVHIGGVKQVASTTDPAYYLDGSKLVFVSPPGAFSPIEVNYLGIAGQVNIPGTQSVTQDMLSLQLANTFVYQTTANGATASFTLNAPPVSANSLVVSANGVVQYDYSVNGTNLTFGFTPPAGTLVRATALALAQAGVPADGSVTSVKLGSNLTLTGNTTFSGNIFASAGSAGSPSISTTGDTNTGMFFPAADTIAFSEGGVESMRIDSSGRVGIGTSSPATPLNIVGSTTAKARLNVSGYAGLEIGQNADFTSEINQRSGSALLLKTSDTERMRIDSSGNVGIGTSSPSGRLHVTTTGSAANLFVTSDISTSALASRVLLGNSTGTARLTLGLLGGGGEVAYLGPEGVFPMYFQTNGTERMRITSGGDVGIGTSSISDKTTILDASSPSFVYTTTKGSLGLENSVNAGDLNALGPSIFFRQRFGSGGTIIQSAAIVSIKTTSSGNFGGGLAFYTQPGSAADMYEVMRYNSNGNFGIGTTNPSDRLVVRGAASVYGDERRLIQVIDTTAIAAGVGGGISFYGVSESGGGLSQFGSIKGIKENATSANYAGALAFVTSNSSNVQTERMRITSGGSVGIATTSPVASLEIYRANSTTGSQTDTSLMLSTSATTGRKVNIGFGLGGGVANTLAATIGYDVTNGAGAGLGDIFFSTRNTTADSVPTERMRLDSNGKFYVASGSDIATGNAPFQQSYVTRFTNLGTTPQSVNYSAGNAFVVHFFLQTVGSNPHQASFTIYGGRQAAVSHRFTGYAGGNCSISETSEGVFSITGLGDSVTYTLTINTGSPSATLAASSTQTGTTTLTAFCISSSI